MKKIIIVGIITFAVGAIISPIAGMAINSTRSMILGMAPDEAILVLADKIDSNEVDNETKIAELQSTVDNQKTEIANYQQQVEAQYVEITEMKADNQDIQVKVTNETECRQLYVDNPECTNSMFKDMNSFEKVIKSYGEGMSKEATDAYRSRKLKVFRTCQEIFAKCG